MPHRALVRYARRRVAPDAVADVAAETFAIAWRRWEKAEAGGLPWLYLTARHVVANSRRSVRADVPLDDVEHALAFDDPSGVVADRLLIREQLSSLSEGDREVLMLVYWEDLDLRAVGRVLGCSAGAAGVRLHRARRRLGAALGPPVRPRPPVSPAAPRDREVHRS